MIRQIAIVLSGLILLLAMPAWAAKDDQKTEKEKKQVEAQKTEYDAHRPYVTFHFNDAEMDFIFEFLLGSATTGGCEIGEAFYTAGSIKDGDPGSWQEEWEKMGQRTEARAEKSLAGGHKVSAAEAFFRAGNYYRTAVVSMMPDNPKLKMLGEKGRACVKKGGQLFDPPLEYFEIPYEDTVMPGYFWKVDNSGRKRKTLIMIGGGETFIEDNLFYIAYAARKRGYNFLTIDLPGQGMLPLEGKFFRYDMEVPMKSVIDHALLRPEVDPEGLAMYGISGGGYFVPRAATVDKRLKAIAVNSAVVDQYIIFSNMPNSKATPEELETWGAFKKATASVVSSRFGLDTSDIIGLAEANKDYRYDPKLITCPALAMIGEGEYANDEMKKQQHQFIDALPNPNKKLVVTPMDEGASSHCIAENRGLMSQVLFDWLDDIFDK